jgi:hypothetical protein
MSRSTNSTFLANLANRHVEKFPLVEMQLASGTLRMAGVDFAVQWNGFTWVATYGLGHIEKIIETDNEVAGCAFELSSVPSTTIALVLTENVRGRPVIVREASLNAGVLTVDGSVWIGELDQMMIRDGKETGTVRVTAEHKLVSWQRPHPVNFSHAEQQLVDPVDTFFSRAATISRKTITWPSKDFR